MSILYMTGNRNYDVAKAIHNFDNIQVSNPSYYRPHTGLYEGTITST